MAKTLKRMLAMVLAIAICAGIALPAFANERASDKFPIDKTANGLDANDQTDVTLTVPGTIEGAIDVVFILGGGMTENMETIQSAINVFKPAMESGKATVRMGLISLEKGQEIILDLNSPEAVLDPATYVDFVTEKFDSIKDLPTGSTNLHSQLVEAQKMLAEEENAKPENKYLFVMATGRTYWYDNEQGDATTIITKDTDKKQTKYFWGIKAYQALRGRNNNLYLIPSQYKDNFDEYWADVEEWVKEDIENGDKYAYTVPGSKDNDNWYNTWYAQHVGASIKFNGSTHGNELINLTPENFVTTGVIDGVTWGVGVQNALNYERAQYEAAQVYKELVASGYNCYAICSETPMYQNNTDRDCLKSLSHTGAYTAMVGHSFMDYLARLGGQDAAPVVWEFLRDENGDAVFYEGYEGNWKYAKTKLRENFFESVRDDMLYTTSKGTTVEDFIGANENGNFEFIENADYIKLVVGGKDYITTMISDTEEGSSYAFAKEEGAEPTFWLDYYYGDGETTERFVWTFGENVSLERLASLTYKLQLTEKQEVEGTYTVPTNNSATLYPVDSDGNAGDPQVFPIPEVTYTVVSGTDIVIKKVDENGNPLTGAEFALLDSNGKTLGIATVDAKGELTFSGVKVGTYTLVETKTPEGYVGLSKPITFEVVFTNNQFAVSITEEYVVQSTMYEISNHVYYPAIPQNFVLVNADNADNWTYTGEYDFGQSDFEVVYCADSTVGIVGGSVYKNYALEEIFPEAAEKLRAIIANSYPYVSLEDMIDVAVAAGVADAENLTRGDVIAAVQLAIWSNTNPGAHSYSNGKDYMYRDATYSVADYPKWGKVFHDYADELPDYLPKNTTKKINDTAGSARVDALYNYLMALEPMSVEDCPINVVCYEAEGGKEASQTLIGATTFKDTTITVENRTKFDIDIVLALGAGIAKYDNDYVSSDGTAYHNTYDSIVNLVKPLVEQGYNVKLGLVAVEHYTEKAMDLTVLNKDNYEEIIQNGLVTIQNMPAGPTNLEGVIAEAYNMLTAESEANVPAANKFFHVIATGRTYCFDDENGNPATTLNTVSLKGETYYYWGHYAWQSQRGRHTSLYLVPQSYNDNWDAYWADVVAMNRADNGKYDYTMPGDYSDPAWYVGTNGFYTNNSTDAKAMKLASSRFGWIIKALTGQNLDAISSSANPGHAMAYDRGQYEAWMAYEKMKEAGINCYALCSENTSYQNGSPYMQVAGYTGGTKMQIGHSFMNFLAGGEATLIFPLLDPNTGASGVAENFFTAIDVSKLEKTVQEEKVPMFSTGPKKPIVITNTLADVEVAIGEKFSITVEATGEGLTYQWFYMNKGGKEFAPSAFTGKSYAMTMAEYCNGRQVYCVVTDANGNTVTSNTVTITRPALELKLNAQLENVEAAIGEKFSITVDATGDGLTYQWYYSDNGGKSFATSSFKGKSYAMTMASYCHGRQVYCVITDAYGNKVTTNTVTITRPAMNATIVDYTADVKAAAGERAFVTVNATGDGLTYKWFYKNKNGKTFAASSITGKTYAVSMASYCDMREVYCVITDAYGNTVTTKPFTLVMEK